MTSSVNASDAARDGSSSSSERDLRSVLRGKRIAFVMFPGAGHIVPTFHLAKWLRDVCGAEVLFLGVIDFEEFVTCEGFTYVSMIEHVAPRGYLEAMARSASESASRHMKQGETRGHLPGPGELLSAFARSPACEPFLAALDLDLLAVDAMLWQFLLVATKLGIPRLSIETDGVRRTKPFAIAAPRDVTITAAAAGPARLVANATYRFDELFLGPACLAMAGHPRGTLGLSIDRTRHESTFPWERLGTKRLVYCSLGTQTHHYEAANRLLSEIAQALVARPEFQLVVHGGHLTREDLGGMPDDALVVVSVPQLRLLERAAVFITHGGLGAVKEAIVCGVPMLVLPLHEDQLFNAHNVQRLGLGVVCNPATVSADLVAAQLEVLDRGPYRGALDTLRGQIAEDDEFEVGAEVLRTALARGEEERGVVRELVDPSVSAKEHDDDAWS